VAAAPDKLLEAIVNLNTADLKPFPKKDACSIADEIDAIMGRPKFGSQ
jgi:hypothetical protein